MGPLDPLGDGDTERVASPSVGGHPEALSLGRPAIPSSRQPDPLQFRAPEQALAQEQASKGLADAVGLAHSEELLRGGGGAAHLDQADECWPYACGSERQHTSSAPVRFWYGSSPHLLQSTTFNPIVQNWSWENNRAAIIWSCGNIGALIIFLCTWLAMHLLGVSASGPDVS